METQGVLLGQGIKCPKLILNKNNKVMCFFLFASLLITGLLTFFPIRLYHGANI